MDQQKGAGHHIITTTAVHRLFAEQARDGRILGMTEAEFAHSLDRAQEHMDRWYGPTILPFWLDEAAQKQHGIANPHLSAEENVSLIKGWVEDNTVKAVILAQQKKIGDAIKALGAAVHALEDTYSEAHVWRSVSEHFGVETAAIEQIMVFDPTGLSGGKGIIGDALHLKDVSMGTHDEWFDRVPLDKRGQMVEGDDRAATNAIQRLLESFVAAYDCTRVPDTGASEAEDFRGRSHGQMSSSVSGIRAIVDEGIAPLLQVAEHARVASSPKAPGWDEERHERRAEDQAQIDQADAVRAPEIDFDGVLQFEPSNPSGGQTVTVRWRDVNRGGSCPSYSARISWTDAGGDHQATLENLELEQNDSRERSIAVDLGAGSGVGQFRVAHEIPGATRSSAELTASVDIF
jgi:hypothetical protein